MTGGLLASPLKFRLARKWLSFIAYLTSVGGVLLQVFAPNLACFAVGVSINRVALGLANSTQPPYISEVNLVLCRDDLHGTKCVAKWFSQVYEEELSARPTS